MEKNHTPGRVERIFVGANRILIGGMMMVMFILVFSNVVTRYAFKVSIAVSEEISTFLMIWITYLGAGLALREGRHAAIDLFQDLLPEKLRTGFRAVLGALIIIFLGLLAWYGIRFSLFRWSQETAVTQIPKGIPYLAVPVGAALFIVHFLFIFRRWIHRDWEGAMGHDDAPLTGEEP